MRAALMVHPANIRHDGRLLQAPMDIPEDSIQVAMAQGWMLLASDSDVLQPEILPLHSNPRRHEDRT